jgi:hypothetical protein
MQEDGSRTLGKSTDESFCNTVLPMGANGTESKILLITSARVAKKLRTVDAVVSAYIFNLDAKPRRKLFEF